MREEGRRMEGKKDKKGKRKERRKERGIEKEAIEGGKGSQGNYIPITLATTRSFMKSYEKLKRNIDANNTTAEEGRKRKGRKKMVY